MTLCIQNRKSRSLHFKNRGFIIVKIAGYSLIIRKVIFQMAPPLYPRWQQPIIEQALETRRVLLLNGPRQCGKTTLAKQMVSDDTAYRTLDDLALRQLAETDPHGFVKASAKTLIIDEVQRVPALLSAIKMVVDENTKPGQYLLTGSANIQSLPGVQESLAGRIRKLRLRPLSQGELSGASPTFIQKAFEASFLENGGRVFDRQTILELSFRGGFPEAIALDDRERRRWHRDYVAALLERDLQDIAQIQRQDAMRELVNVLAAWSSKFMDISAIGSGLAIRRPTLESYINALETLYIVERVLPWTRTDYDRVGKQSKLFMTDCGLMASILGWQMDQVALDTDRSGKLIETFVFNEIAAQLDASDGVYELFHYRDREQREIDFLIQRDDGALLGIEVKAGSAIGKNDFRHLRWFKEHLAKDRPFVGIVLYTGEFPGSMGDNLWAVPFGALWAN
jgi:predicted AAA+ superfamily ATPase